MKWRKGHIRYYRCHGSSEYFECNSPLFSDPSAVSNNHHIFSYIIMRTSTPDIEMNTEIKGNVAAKPVYSFTSYWIPQQQD